MIYRRAVYWIKVLSYESPRCPCLFMGRGRSDHRTRSPCGGIINWRSGGMMPPFDHWRWPQGRAIGILVRVLNAGITWARVRRLKTWGGVRSVSCCRRGIQNGRRLQVQFLGPFWVEVACSLHIILIKNSKLSRVWTVCFPMWPCDELVHVAIRPTPQDNWRKL